MKWLKRKADPASTMTYEWQVTHVPPSLEALDEFYLTASGGWGHRREEAAEAQRIKVLEARAAAAEEARHAGSTDGFRPTRREHEWPANIPRPPVTPSIQPDDLP